MTTNTQIPEVSNQMPIRAYILVNTDPGKAKDVADEASKIKGNSPRVNIAHAVTGRFDVVVQVEADDTDSLKDITKLVLSKIPKVAGVCKTETLLVT